MELVGEEPAGRKARYGDGGSVDVRDWSEPIGCALRRWVWNVVMVSKCGGQEQKHQRH